MWGRLSGYFFLMIYIWDIKDNILVGAMSYNYASKHGSAVALRMGYKEFPDENAYDDACYIKDALKWVFKRHCCK